MIASQLWYPEILHSGPKHEFFFFYQPRVCEMLRNTSKHHFGSNGLEWMLHNFGTPEILHLGPKHKFCTFYVLKVSEMLRNTRKHHFGSNGQKGCFTTLVPRNRAFRLEHKFCILYVPEVSEIIRNRHKHHLGSNGLEWMLHNFGTPK
jgi:hypothetical protein